MFDNARYVVDEIVPMIEGQGNTVINSEPVFCNILKDLKLEPEEKELLTNAVSQGLLELLRKNVSNNCESNDFNNALQKFIKSQKLGTTSTEKNYIYNVFSGLYYFCHTMKKTILNESENGVFLSEEETVSLSIANAANLSRTISTIVNVVKKFAALIITGVIILFILILVLILKSCSPDDVGQGNKNNYSGESGYYDNNYSSDYDDDGYFSTPSNDDYTSQTGGINSDDDTTSGNTQDFTDSQTTTQSTTTPPEPTKTKITGNKITGTLKDEADIAYYSFTPENSGMHRFDFDISNVNANYEFEVTTSKGGSWGEFYYSSRDKGVSIELNAGETYTITVAYRTMACNYDITIGKPDPVKTITGTSVSGSLNYEDKLNEYEYTAPKTGVYRFNFDISNVNADFNFKMYNSKSAEICDVDYSSASYATQYPGTTISLTAGETYTIWVWQDYLTCDYTINIGVPNDTAKITSNVVNGSFKYLDQENTYTYTAPKTGTYTFYLDISNTAADFELIMKNSKNSTVRSTNYAAAKYAKKRAEFSADLKAGETYKITVYQDYLLCDYTIEIALP